MVTSIILFALQWCLVGVGIVGNIWVIVAITRYNAIKRAANKIMFINLAVADMGVLIIRNPFFFLSRYFNGRWLFGNFTCRIMMPFSLIFVPASVLILVAISYSRYRAIVYVKQLKEMSTRMAKYTVVLIWTFVIVFYPVIEIPVRRLNETAETCDFDVPHSVSTVLYGLEDFYFLLAFVAITLMFIRIRQCLLKFSKIYDDLETMETLMKNKKALKLLWPVVVALFVTMTPFIIGRIWNYVIMRGDGKEIPTVFNHVVEVLLITNSTINPFIYIIVSTEFSQKFFQLPCVRIVRFLYAKPRHSRSQTQDIILYPYESNANGVHESRV